MTGPITSGEYRHGKINVVAVMASRRRSAHHRSDQLRSGRSGTSGPTQRRYCGDPTLLLVMNASQISSDDATTWGTMPGNVDRGG
jgi:hypothetical protein